ncbi:MAG: hypothetical protein ACLKAK_00915 [Alkaliphilus sp.]
MRLVDLIYTKYKIISVVGMSKNAGKTVTLNYLIEKFDEIGAVIGITSTGRDGEKLDIVTKTEKPTIFVMKNTIIASAKEALLKSSAKLEILEITNSRTSLGEVVIARVKGSGYVEIAGPETNTQIKMAASKMLDYGAEIVVLDGAINRKTAAAPTISEATILATGAALSRDMNNVIEETVFQVELYSLEAVKEDELKIGLSKSFKDKEFIIIDNEGKSELINITTTLSSGRVIGEAINEDSKYVVLSGSIVYKTFEDIVPVAENYKDVIYIVQDATKIFVSSREWKMLKKKGISIRVMDKINLLAVTLNPYSPYGYNFDSKDFLHALKKRLPKIAVIDVVEGENADD